MDLKRISGEYRGERGELDISIIIEILRFVRYEVNHFNAKPDIPIVISHEINML